MIPIAPAMLPVADGAALIGYFAPVIQVSPFEVGLAVLEIALGAVAIMTLRHLKGSADPRPAFFARHWSPVRRLPKAA